MPDKFNEQGFTNTLFGKRQALDKEIKDPF